ncbi:radical SAM protein [Clostridiaceae bacterium M8S5]|nr:radical SAM protein [Clostridiaceae bacterium M8S5]
MSKRTGQVMILLAPSEHAYQQISNIPPLALGVLKGFLSEKGISTYIYDLNVTLNKRSDELPLTSWRFIYDSKRIIGYLNGKSDQEIDDLISRLISGINFNGYDLVGISLGADFSWLEMHGGMVLAKWISKKYKVHIEIGGNNVHYLLQFKDNFVELWEALLSTGFFICVGPGERMFLDLIKMLEKGEMDEERFHLIPGAVWKEGDEIKSNMQDAPSLTMPDFSGLDLDPYKVCINYSTVHNAQSINEIQIMKWPQPYPLIASQVNRASLPEEDRKETLVIPYIFNYNCPYSCAFCVQSGGDKKKIVVKSTKVILDEIETMMQKYSSKFFYFYNNTFNYSRKFVIEFCEGVQQRGMKFYWSDCARFNNLDYDLLKMLFDSGCRKFVFGFETGSQKLLKLYDKRLDLEHAEQVLKWCKELGIWADIEVIVGLPYENEEDFECTIEFIQKNRHLINHFAMNRYFVVPDSLIGMKPADYGIKLMRMRNRYEFLLKMNYKYFIEGSLRGKGATNFQVYRYNEINGRAHNQVVDETNKKIHRLVDVYSKLPIAQETKLIEWRYSKVK